MTIQSMANSEMAKSMMKLSAGQRINRAADDAAGLAISEKMNAQISGSNQNVNNISDMGNLLNTAEGSLESINDSLSRIRELSVQASNGILTNDDKQIIQNEIEGLKKGISSTVNNTEFNTMKVLDGSFTNKNVAMNTSGSGSRISIENSSLETLGIKEFDVTKSFDIADIDNAIGKVTESRSKIGSVSNTFEHALNNTKNKIINETRAMSQIKDADIAAEVSSYKKNKVLEQYSIAMQRESSRINANKLGMYTDLII
ncbi:MAG: flagellin [Firmicutes bacterium HGW-Firmicutes-1]|jgi:flagellin|nr:MAG: flagellin [Firmicutes bacterium HGW-Firmicutes-1]